jgi:hypothetical protein
VAGGQIVTADQIKALIKRIRDTQSDCADSLNAAGALETLLAENQRIRLEFRADCEKQAEELFAIGRKLELATQELKNIANADTVEWDDPAQYEAWAKSRARWALGKVGEEKS